MMMMPRSLCRPVLLVGWQMRRGWGKKKGDDTAIQENESEGREKTCGTLTLTLSGTAVRLWERTADHTLIHSRSWRCQNQQRAERDARREELQFTHTAIRTVKETEQHQLLLPFSRCSATRESASPLSPLIRRSLLGNFYHSSNFIFFSM
jgi:hypothetical protein